MKELKAIERGPITQEQLRAYADASGDFNPIHLDKSVANAAGFENTIVHGMLSMGIMGDWIATQFPESQFEILSFKAKFKKITLCGDKLVCQGEVKAEEGSKLTVAITIKNQRQEITTEGIANIRQI